MSATLLRSTHRSTLFRMTLDISPLMGDDGEPLVSGDELRAILLAWCADAIDEELRKGREKIPNHP